MSVGSGVPTLALDYLYRLPQKLRAYCSRGVTLVLYKKKDLSELHSYYNIR